MAPPKVSLFLLNEIEQVWLSNFDRRIFLFQIRKQLKFVTGIKLLIDKVNEIDQIGKTNFVHSRCSVHSIVILIDKQSNYATHLVEQKVLYPYAREQLS
jgi:hypothetical protein